MAAAPTILSATIPASSNPIVDPVRLRRIAMMAEAGGLDFLVLPQPADAMIAARWLIPATRRIGLVSALPATFSEPFHVARALSAMDILSGGRMGWMPGVGDYQSQSPHFSDSPPLASPVALDKAAEFVAAAEALWDSWDADARIIDKESARYLDKAKIRRVHFRGEHFRVMGPLNAPRPPQGYPVLALDEADPLFERLCGHADVLLIAAITPADAKRRAAALRGDRAQRILIKVSGAPLADSLEEWRTSADCDGFHFLADDAPHDFEGGLERLLSELRRRGWPVGRVSPGTLRARLGAAIPINPYSRG